MTMAHAFFDPSNFDLITPDGCLTSLSAIDARSAQAKVLIENISPRFVGFGLDSHLLLFNVKSTLAQLGVDAVASRICMDRLRRAAEVEVQLTAYGSLGVEMLRQLQVGAYIGKLFALDDRRRVRDPHYLSRMFGRVDRWGRPLLLLGGMNGTPSLVLEKVDGHTVAFLSLQQGCVAYDESIKGFLPTLGKALFSQQRIRDLLQLHQQWNQGGSRTVCPGEILLVKTIPLHMRTVFGHVVDELLAPGFRHTSASVLQPDTQASGDIYELYGNSPEAELKAIPLEFYTLEPYREYVYFTDRRQLQTCLRESKTLFQAFATAPAPKEHKAAVFVVKGEQLLHLRDLDWVIRSPHPMELPGLAHSSRHALVVERYIEQQPCYPFLEGIEHGPITSQGVLLTRFFPTPFLKRLLLSDQVQRCLKGIYFQYPSLSHGQFFSHEDRALLHDLYKFAVPVFWLDDATHQILQYIEREGKDTGMFVPLDRRTDFSKSSFFGIYGSNLLAGRFEQELRHLLLGVQEMQPQMSHPLLNSNVNLALVTGGGPGAMEMGNRVAKEIGILSCANIVDLSSPDGQVVNEQRQNPYVEAKMSYRIDQLVERQAEFHLDFPIFLKGGVGTDFEFALEEVRRKTGAMYPPTPILLFGTMDHWRQKLSYRFRCNRAMGTIAGSEWLSNCLYCIQTAEQGLKIYRAFFEHRLAIGKGGPIYDDGFADVSSLAL